MKKTLSELLSLILITCAGTAGAIVVGLLLYGGGVFNPGSPGFSFVSFGVSGSFIFAFYHVRGLSETITAAVIVSVIQFIVASVWVTLLNAGIWSFGVNLPVVVLAFVYERKLERFQYLKFLVAALTYGAMFVLLTLVVSLLSGGSTPPALVFRENFMDGLSIGCGIGLGVMAAENLLHAMHVPDAVHRHA